MDNVHICCMTVRKLLVLLCHKDKYGTSRGFSVTAEFLAYTVKILSIVPSTCIFFITWNFSHRTLYSCYRVLVYVVEETFS